MTCKRRRIDAADSLQSFGLGAIVVNDIGGGLVLRLHLHLLHLRLELRDLLIGVL